MVFKSSFKHCFTENYCVFSVKKVCFWTENFPDPIRKFTNAIGELPAHILKVMNAIGELPNCILKVTNAIGELPAYILKVTNAIGELPAHILKVTNAIGELPDLYSESYKPSREIHVLNCKLLQRSTLLIWLNSYANPQQNKIYNYLNGFENAVLVTNASSSSVLGKATKSVLCWVVSCKPPSFIFFMKGEIVGEWIRAIAITKTEYYCLDQKRIKLKMCQIASWVLSQRC